MGSPPTVAATNAGPTLAIDRDRLLRVVEAHLSIVDRSDLPGMLRDLVETACSLLDAPYGVMDFRDLSELPLEHAVRIGLDARAAAALDRAPQWEGALGTWVAQRGPARSADLTADPRWLAPASAALRSAIAVPVHTADNIVGHLVVAAPQTDRFDDNDEFVLLGVAATAGIAIANARRAEETRLRQAWLGASTEVTQRLVGREEPDPLRLIATRISELADADSASIVLPTADSAWLETVVAVGPASAGLVGIRLPRDGSVCGTVMTTGRAQTRPGLVPIPGMPEAAKRFGVALAMPLAGHAGTRGVLTIARAAGRRPFTAIETQMAAVFANHAAVALELLDAQDDRRRVSVFVDRDRIALELHDQVIQRLFATGLRLHSLATLADDAGLATELTAQAAALADTIGELRTAIFDLRDDTDIRARGLRRDLLDVVADLTPALGFAPRVGFEGQVETSVPAGVAHDAIAIVREGLTNIARHAHARSGAVEVVVDADRLLLDVVDDGVGLAGSSRRSGLANVEARAVGRGGRLQFVPTLRGTHLRVALPLRAES